MGRTALAPPARPSSSTSVPTTRLMLPRLLSRSAWPSSVELPRELSRWPEHPERELDPTRLSRLKSQRRSRRQRSPRPRSQRRPRSQPRRLQEAQEACCQEGCQEASQEGRQEACCQEGRQEASCQEGCTQEEVNCVTFSSILPNRPFLGPTNSTIRVYSLRLYVKCVYEY